jgi:chromosome segregation ATPase
MAIENNKNNSLPSDLNDDSNVNPDTLSVESLPGTNRPDFRQSSDETGDFERTANIAELTNKTKAELKSEITARSESISRLRFDIQQLRSKWSGLEKEIEAREGLTRKLNRRLSDTQQKLAHAKSVQSARETENDALRANLDDKLSLLTSVRKEAKKISETVESGKFLIDELQQKIARQQSTIRKLKREIKNFATRKREALDTLSDKEKQIAKLKADVSASTRQSACQERDLSGLRNELGIALQEIKHLRTSLHGDRASERREGHRRAADQDGLFIRNLQEINALKKQIVRTESYADKIRARLQDVVSDTDNEHDQRSHLEKSLAQMSRQVLDLEKQLQDESIVTAELRQENQSIRRKFAEEIRLVRFELGSAEQTLAGQETISEQLASDLIDNQGFRQALESQLESSSVENEKSISDLSRKMKALQTANEDIERQLENKDNAIAALLSELGSRSRTISSTGESENVIHEIDGHISDRIGDKSSAEKDRMARLLIGNVDGQKLRFPLFKDRLTIGRTAHNDIQLKAHFISRRHAVIVTENGTSRIVDWGSKNGVYVNDTRVAEQTLRNGDLVAIGTAEFRYEERPKR